MRFELSEDAEWVRSTVREFAEGELAAGASVRDEEEQYDKNVFNQLARIGLTGIPWPEQEGGAGSDWLTYAITVEELSRVCASTGASLAAHVHASLIISRQQCEERRGLILRELAEGKQLAAYASMEGCELLGEELVLGGVCRHIANAGSADLYVILLPDHGAALMLNLTAAGFELGAQESKLGLRSLSTRELQFLDCRAAKDQLLLLKQHGDGPALPDLELLSSAVQAVGVAQAAMEAAAAYAKSRSQFGKRIGQHQAIAFKIADMAAKLEAARLLAYQAAWRMDEGLSCWKQADIAGRFAAEAAAAITTEAVQIFGGYGYMREYRVERYMRDAQSIGAYLPSSGNRGRCGHA
ncbi:acyl-CoA dehydrogenase family protein [Paenibacillus sp. GCM10023252]|uniref:acyl-CoA dehydrogenase family protein n=1 Tax=Paenibacillus sp. GCM10023252 TaxID=3252649 RepID=UPI003621A97E